MIELPELITLDSFDGDWNKYCEALYSFFKEDFFKSNLSYDGDNIYCIKDPYFDNKEFAFWHLITEGKIEEERNPDMRRCERIKWPRAIIENFKHPDIKIWITERRNKKGKKQKRVCFAPSTWEYIVILNIRNGYYMLCTAYPIERENRRMKFKKEYDRYVKNANTAP